MTLLNPQTDLRSFFLFPSVSLLATPTESFVLSVVPLLFLASRVFLPETPTTVTSHQLCLVYIIITYLHICLPCIMLILLVPVLCFCLPCVIRLMGMLQLGTQTQKGARQEEIEKLPTGAGRGVLSNARFLQ